MVKCGKIYERKRLKIVFGKIMEMKGSPSKKHEPTEERMKEEIKKFKYLRSLVAVMRQKKGQRRDTD